MRTARPREPAGSTGIERRADQEALLLGALVLSSAALFVRMIAEPFDHGYLRYAAMAAEMVHSGDWVVPQLRGQPYVDKPPLYIWLQALPMAWAGSAAGWAQHVPNAIAYVLSSIWTGAFARRFFRGVAPPLAAVLVLATTFSFFFLIRGKRLDALFAAWFTGCLYLVHGLLSDRATMRGRGLRWLGASVLLALAILTKGPLALLLLLAIIVPHAAWAGRLGRLRTPGAAAALVVTVALVSIWPALMVSRFGLDGALDLLGGSRLVTRAGGPFHYLVRFFPAFAPWSLLVPAVALWLVVSRPDRARRDLRLPICWILGVLVPLQFSPAKHSRYLAPLLPAVALLVTAAWRAASAGQGGRLLPRAGDWLWRAGLAAFLGTSLVAALVAPAVAWQRAGDWPPTAALLPPVLALAAAGTMGLRALLRGDRSNAFVASLLAAVVGFAAYDAARAWQFHREDRGAGVVSALAPVAGGAPACIYRAGTSGWAISVLASGRGLPVLATAEAVAQWLDEHAGEPAYVVTREEGAEDLASVGRLDLEHAVRIVPSDHRPLLLVPTREASP